MQFQQDKDVLSIKKAPMAKFDCAELKYHLTQNHPQKKTINAFIGTDLLCLLRFFSSLKHNFIIYMMIEKHLQRLQ